MTEQNPSHLESRARILQTAAALFAQKGFHRTSIRDLTAAAGVNVAAVHYHFGSKADLYRAVLAEELRASDCRSCGQGATPPLPSGLNALLRCVFDSLRTHQDSVLRQILVQEEASPSGVLGPVLGDLVRPRHEALVEALAREASSSLPRATIHRIAKTLVDAVKGYELDSSGVFAHLSPETFAGPDAREAAIADLANQARDLLDGAVRRHQEAQS